MTNFWKRYGPYERDPSCTLTTSQIGQDVVIDKFLFQELSEGVFVDVGAHDGITFSNTWFFEKERGWTGLCVEANPILFEKLKENRSCFVSNALVSSMRGREFFTILEGHTEMLSGASRNYEKKHLRRIAREMKQYGGVKREVLLEAAPLQDLLDERGIAHIDLLCVDVEGSEPDVLHGLDFNKTRVRAILIERNYSAKKVWRILHHEGFFRLMAIGWDDLYIDRRWVVGLL